MKKKFFFGIFLAFTLILTLYSSNSESKNHKNLENLIYLQLKHGRVVIKTFPDVAPKTVNRIKELSKEGFYDGLKFHRVIAGFMAQTGDPRGDGTGGSDKSDLPAEFNDISHTRGIVSMARANDPNSANSQFFICLDDSTFLDGQYTAWGEVISGMHAVDKIKLGEGDNGKVLGEPSRIISMKVAANEESDNKPSVPDDAKTKK